MKKPFRYLVPAGILIIAVICWLGYLHYVGKSREETFQKLAASFFKAASGLRMIYLNELGVIRLADISGSDDLKNIPLLLEIRRNLAQVHSLETAYDSSSCAMIESWTDSVTAFRKKHPDDDLDTLEKSICHILRSNRQLLDSIRPLYLGYYEKYTGLIDLLVENNEKISIIDGKVVIMDKALGIRINELQAAFSAAIGTYTRANMTMKSALIEILGKYGTLFPAGELDILLSLYQENGPG